MKKVGFGCLVGLVFAGVSSVCSALDDGTLMKHKVYAVILAGGRGERLWPLSRQHKPKQLLSVDGNASLIEQAVDRVAPLIPRERIFICTTEEHAVAIKQDVGHKIGRIIAEPIGRNTGPATLLSCLQIQQEDPDARVLFLPADAYIPTHENDLFRHFVQDGIDFILNTSHLLIFGMQPPQPSTGYGYIEHQGKRGQTGPHKVVTFHEKPSYDTACAYVARGMLCNISMCGGQVALLIDAFKKDAPDVYDAVTSYHSKKADYATVPSISVDYAILECNNNVWVLPVEFTWADAGNVSVFLKLKNQAQALESHLITVNAHNNLIDVPDKLVALIGVDDLCVVQTKDALLITKRDEAEKVRAVVNQLKKEKYTQYL